MWTDEGVSLLISCCTVPMRFSKNFCLSSEIKKSTKGRELEKILTKKIIKKFNQEKIARENICIEYFDSIKVEFKSSEHELETLRCFSTSKPFNYNKLSHQILMTLLLHNNLLPFMSNEIIISS